MILSSCYDAGKTRARDAALNAIQSPLLDIGIERATGIVWNITGGSDLTLFEVGSLLSLLIFSCCYLPLFPDTCGLDISFLPVSFFPFTSVSHYF